MVSRNNDLHHSGSPRAAPVTCIKYLTAYSALAIVNILNDDAANGL